MSYLELFIRQGNRLLTYEDGLFYYIVNSAPRPPGPWVWVKQEQAFVTSVVEALEPVMQYADDTVEAGIAEMKAKQHRDIQEARQGTGNEEATPAEQDAQEARQVSQMLEQEPDDTIDLADADRTTEGDYILEQYEPLARYCDSRAGKWVRGIARLPDGRIVATLTDRFLWMPEDKCEKLFVKY